MTSSRRVVLTLAAAQGLSMTALTLVVTSAALAGEMLATDKAWATLPIACQFLAMMFATMPASLLQARIGRRLAFILGALVQTVGGAVGVLAIAEASLALLCCAHMLLGASTAVAHYYRFAAAEAADPAFRPRAISYVLLGGVFAAIAGPEIAKHGRDLLAPLSFAGIYAAMMGLSAVNALVLSRLRLPPPPAAAPGAGRGRPLAEIARQPVFIVAVAGGMVAYGCMTLVMTATPLAIIACGLAFDDSAFVIQWHALGMFAPALITGRLIGRFGVIRVMQAGCALFLAGVAVNLSGLDLWRFWLGLLLVGVAWNFLFVGATTLATEAWRPEERTRGQGLNELLVFSASATAALAAGKLQAGIGWDAVNLGVLPAVLLVSIALAWLAARRASTAAA